MLHHASGSILTINLSFSASDLVTRRMGIIVPITYCCIWLPGFSASVMFTNGIFRSVSVESRGSISSPSFFLYFSSIFSLCCKKIYGYLISENNNTFTFTTYFYTCVFYLLAAASLFPIPELFYQPLLQFLVNPGWIEKRCSSSHHHHRCHHHLLSEN